MALYILIIGAIVYLLCSILDRYEEVAELGRLAFLAGLLALLLR